MKISVLIHSVLTGGAERLAVSAANWWSRAGHDVSLVTFEDANNDAFQVREQVSRRHLKVPPFARGLALKNAARALALRQLLVYERPNACVAFASIPSAVLGVARTGLKLKAIGRLENHPPHLLTDRVRNTVMWNAFRNLDVVVAQTERSANWALTQAPGLRVVAIPNPAFYPLVDARPRLDPAAAFLPDKKIVLAVGRLEKQKRFDRLIEAFSQATADKSDWVLAILGEGPLRDELYALSSRLKCQDRIKLLGKAGNMGDWYAAASIFALSSDFEGFPNALVEALAHGVPAVAVDCETGPREILRDGMDGFLSAPTVDAMAEKLTNLMSQEPILKRFGQNAIDVRQRLSADRIFEQWDRILYGEIA